MYGLTSAQWHKVRTWCGKHRSIIERCATTGDLGLLARRKKANNAGPVGVGISGINAELIAEMLKLMRIPCPPPRPQNQTAGA